MITTKDPNRIAGQPKKKKAKPFSATAYALKDLRKLGFLAGVVEKWNPHVRIRQDLHGCIDIIASRAGVGVVGIQATGGDHHANRVTKSKAEPRLREWLKGGGRFEVWSYALRGMAGTRKLYQLRREEITLEDLPMEADEQQPAVGSLFSSLEKVKGGKVA